MKAIDQAKQEVTLQGPLGHTATFSADKRVKCLNEVKVDDLVSADCHVFIAAELRKPTAEERENATLRR